MAETETAERPSLRETAGDAVEKLGDNPLALVVGGLAVGMIIGALLPRLAKERELLAPLGQRIADGTGAAVRAARETGKNEINALLPDRQATKDRVSQLFGSVLDSAKQAAKNKP
jgi:hypothetical protein